MSGSGKSRMAKELLGLMCNTAKKSTKPVANQLVEFLQKPLTINIAWDNEFSYNSKAEGDWMPELILGLRVAAKHWFPNYQFSSIQRIVNNLSPNEQELFNFKEVVKAIIKENNAKPIEERSSMIYIINDEFQKLKKETHPTKGTLSRAIASEFMKVARFLHQEFFLFGSFIGIGFTPTDIFNNPADGLYPGYCVCRLSISSMVTIIRTELGEEWANIPDLPRLLAAFGGNPRVLEIFVESVARKYSVAAYNTQLLFGMTEQLTFKRYPNPLAEAPMEWPALLSFAGYPIESCSTYIAWMLNKMNPNIIEKWTAGQIEQQGYISLCGPTLGVGWAPKSNPPMVLDTPLLVAKAAVRTPAVQYRGTEEISGGVKSALLNQFNSIATNFFTDAYGFEKLGVEQFIFRWNMFNFTSDATCVRAKDLFYGGYFTERFAQYEFAHEQDILTVCAAKPHGIWAESPAKAKDIVELQDGTMLKFTDDVHRGVHFGGRNVFDGHLRLFDSKKNRVIIWIDTKHTPKTQGNLDPKEVIELRKKLEGLAKKLPQYSHLLVVISNRKYTHDPNNLNDNMCILVRDGLSFGTSPWFSLAAQTEFTKDREDKIKSKKLKAGEKGEEVAEPYTRAKSKKVKADAQESGKVKETTHAKGKKSKKLKV